MAALRKKRNCVTGESCGFQPTGPRAIEDPCSNITSSQAQHSAVQGDFSLEDGSTVHQSELGPTRDNHLLESCIRASMASEVLSGICSSYCSEPAWCSPSPTASQSLATKLFDGQRHLSRQRPDLKLLQVGAVLRLACLPRHWLVLSKKGRAKTRLLQGSE